MRLAFLPKADALLQIAFSGARKHASGVKIKGKKNRFKEAKAKELVKIETAYNIIDAKLMDTVKQFPSINKMPEFAKELLEATIDADKAKKALGHITAARKILKKIRFQKTSRIKSFGWEKRSLVTKESREFFGRISSIVKSLDNSIEIFNETARKMNELPSINFEAPSIILAGFPNTGKSTILGRLTKSKPKIASYPFTTQKLQIGYFEAKYQKIQVIDTPGLLDRSIEKRNKIERKAIAAIRHLAKIIIFVLDPRKQSEYTLESQLSLLREIKKIIPNAKIIVAINKADIAKKQEIEAVQNTLKEDSIIEGEGIESKLKEKISETLFE